MQKKNYMNFSQESDNRFYKGCDLSWVDTTIEWRESSIMWSCYIRKKVHPQFLNANDYQTW